MNAFRKLYTSLLLVEAMRQADAAAARTGLRYFVVPDGAGHLVYMDRANFRGLKRKRYMNRAVRMDDLRADCFYYTAKKGRDPMGPEETLAGRARCFAWAEGRAKAERAARKAARAAKKGRRRPAADPPDNEK